LSITRLYSIRITQRNNRTERGVGDPGSRAREFSGYPVGLWLTQGCGVADGAFVGVMDETVSVFGEQEAEFALRLVFAMFSCPMTFTQLPIVGYDDGKFCNVQCTQNTPDLQ